MVTPYAETYRLVPENASNYLAKLYTREQLVSNRRLQNMEKGEDDT